MTLWRLTAPRPQICCQPAWQISRIDVSTVKSDKQIKSVIKSRCFQKGLILPNHCLPIFLPAVIFVQMWKKNTSIVPFLPCLYLFQSVNSVVLTPLHGLGKLSLQQTAIPRSITGLFRSSHRGLLAKKTLLILFSAGQREE